MQPQALTLPVLNLLVPTVTTFPQSHLHTVVDWRCFVLTPLRMVAFGSPGPITTRCPNLVPGLSCTSSFRPRPILTFISSPLNIDRRPAGTEPCARTQMPAGRLKELIVSFCGGSDPHCHRWQRTYYTIFLRTCLRPAAPESNRRWRRPFRFRGSKPREFSRRSSWRGCRFRRLATGRFVVP